MSEEQLSYQDFGSNRAFLAWASKRLRAYRANVTTHTPSPARNLRPERP